MRKYLYAALLTPLLALVAGCPGQAPTPTPTYGCAVTSDTAFGPINAPGSTTGVTYKDVAPLPAGCYFVVTYQGSGNSGPSNVALALLSTTDKVVNISWVPPTSCAGCSYVLYRAAATAVVPTAPQQLPPTTAVSHNDAPLLHEPDSSLAYYVPSKLTAKPASR